MNEYMSRIHLLEGHVLTEELDNGELVQMFAADVVDTWAYFTATSLHGLMVNASVAMTASIEDIQRCLDAGCDTLVVQHSAEGAKIHLIKGAPAVGVAHSAPPMLQ